MSMKKEGFLCIR